MSNTRQFCCLFWQAKCISPPLLARLNTPSRAAGEKATLALKTFDPFQGYLFSSTVECL
jgi:hypothetical protein